MQRDIIGIMKWSKPDGEWLGNGLWAVKEKHIMRILRKRRFPQLKALYTLEIFPMPC